MTKKLTIARWFAAPLLIGALTLTACGSDDDTDGAPSAETPVTAEAGETSDAPEYEDFCAALDDYIQSAPGPDEESDPAEFEPVVAAAPPEIAEDMQDLMAAMVQISEFDEMDASEEQTAEFEAAIAAFDPLATEMQAWSTENCPDVDQG